jgi:hypothetical protein
MNAAVFFTYLFGVGMGIGVACMIAASFIEKRNISGDSHADATMYCRGIALTDRSDNIGRLKSDHEAYIDAHTPAKALYPTAPVDQSQVIRPEKL